MTFASWSTLSFVLTLFVAGGAAGFVAGLFGVGGGILIVPVLYTLFMLNNISPDIAMHVAVGTSLLTIMPTSVASFRSHLAHGAVDKKILKDWMPSILIGSACGSTITHQLSGAFVGLLFGVFVLCISIYMGFGSTPTPSSTFNLSHRKQKLIAYCIGLISSLVGVGGGALTVPTLVASRVSVHRAVGTASAVGFLVSVPAVLVLLFWPMAMEGMPIGTYGQVNLLSFCILAPATMLTAPRGARLAHALNATKLRKYFSIFLSVIALKMILTALWK